jgi:N6-L-threonylcarbamoyladenine synthase
MAPERLILGLESSCDDTAAAILRARPGTPCAAVLANVVLGQNALHVPYGGVVPEIAARAHAERLDLATEAALAEAGIALSALDAIAVTAGPGLIGGVMAGVMFAKGLAAGTGLPLWGINHLAGHALSPRLTEDVDFPYLLLLVSGGHCQILAVEGPARFRRIGGTIDDAVGEAFDKAAKLLGLPQPGGPAIEAAAEAGDAARFAFPRPLLDREGCDLSFSGLKTALRRARDRLAEAQGGLHRRDVADLAASFQTAIAETLAEKTRRALPGFPVLAVAGGVAANATIRAVLTDLAQEAGIRFVAPPLRYCTDNGAMIAFAAAERMALPGARPDALDLTPRPRWPLDEAAAPLLGSGRKGAKA